MTFPPGELPEIDDLEASLCRDSFADFVRLAWPHVPRLSAIPLKWNWHHAAICDHLQAVARGEIRYLLINQPPRSLKTELTGVFFTPWVWTWRPNFKAISASVVQAQAAETSGFCREVVEGSEWYQRVFVRGAWQLRDDKNAKHDFGNTLGGSRFATSVGGTVIGKGADLIIGDDLQKDGDTQAEWDKAFTYWSGTLSSRADDPATVAKILVQQRLGKRDISGRILEHGGFVHLKIPSEYDPRRSVVTCVAGRELFRDPRTVEGELLNPRLDAPEVAASIIADAKTYSRGMGLLKFRAQHNQDPEEETGGEIKRAYWRFYRDRRYESTHRPEGCVTAETHPAVELPPQAARIISADTAVKENQTADWSVVGAIAHAKADIFLTDLDRARVAMPGLIKMFKQACARYPEARQKYIEDKSSGQQLIQLLKVGGEVDGYKFDATPGIVGVNPGNVSKVERTRIHLLPRVEAGQVYLPEGAPWLDAFVAECSEFPFGDHDDQIDMLAQACSKLGASTGLERMRNMSRLY